MITEHKLLGYVIRTRNQKSGNRNSAWVSGGKRQMKAANTMAVRNIIIIYGTGFKILKQKEVGMDRDDCRKTRIDVVRGRQSFDGFVIVFLSITMTKMNFLRPFLLLALVHKG